MIQKKFSAFAVISVFWLVFVAFASAVPPEVTTAFEMKYSAEEVEWEVDKNGNWEGAFDEGGQKSRANFTPGGVWVGTQKSISFEELPDPVKSAVKRQHGDREIAEIVRAESAEKGIFYDVKFQSEGTSENFEYDSDGNRLDTLIAGVGAAAQLFSDPLGGLAAASSSPHEITVLNLLLEFSINLIAITLFAYVIYYRRHHDHRMFFLLLGFNLFLFPIFLLKSVLTAGFGLTIFALLALVRMRSENFNKTEIAYLLGAVSLTFINATLPAHTEYIASAIVLLTAYVGDHPSLWRARFQKVEIRHPISSRESVLDPEFLRDQIATDYNIEVDNIEVDRVEKKCVRMTVIYREKIATESNGKRNDSNPKSGKS